MFELGAGTAGSGGAGLIRMGFQPRDAVNDPHLESLRPCNKLKFNKA